MKFALFMLVMIVITTWMNSKYKLSILRKMNSLNKDTNISYGKKIVETCNYMLNTAIFHCTLVIIIWVLGSTLFYLLIL